MKHVIYADNAATTPVSQAALQAMQPYFSESYGNASAAHSLGQEAKSALEKARRSVADSLGAFVNEIYFTSGGTESANWALACGVQARANKRAGHVIISSIEHSAVFHTAEYLETLGYEVTYLPVSKAGQITPEQLVEAMRHETVLISIMLANNEMGTILPVKALCQAAKERNRRVIFHTDAVQAVGHIPLDVRRMGVDILSLSGHKFGGPKGTGAQFIRLGTTIPPFMHGGGQEKGRRSGTSNMPGIVGMAAALEEAVEGLAATVPQITALRNKLIWGILAIPGAYLTGDAVERLPGSASFVFDGLADRPLVTRLSEQGICVSSGSACSSSSEEPSRVLLAAGYPTELAAAPLRITLSKHNTSEEIDTIISKVAAVVESLRGQSYAPVSLDFSGKP